MKNLQICLFIALCLTACATNPVPDNYTGPLATIRDSTQSETSNRAQFYFLSEINGRRVDNVLIATKVANNGRGFSLNTASYGRDLPAKPVTVTLEGRISYGAPIQEIFNMGTVYTVEKKVSFTPESNKTYVVKGVLTAERKDVWLEDAETGKRVDQ